MIIDWSISDINIIKNGFWSKKNKMGSKWGYEDGGTLKVA